MRHLQQLSDQSKDKGLAVLGFNCSDDKQIALEFMRENEAIFPTILDSSDKAQMVQFRDYRGSGVPLNYIIDREGKVVDAWYGNDQGFRRAKAAMKKGGLDLKVLRPQRKPSKEDASPLQRLFDALRDVEEEPE